MDWKNAPQSQKEEFVNAVETIALPGLFDREYLDLIEIPIPFIKNGYLRVLENLKVAPPFTLDYITANGTIIYLDGSPEPFLTIAQHPDFHLTHETVQDYLRYYCAYVIQRPHNIMLFQGADLMPFDDTIYLDFQFDKQNLSEKDIKTEALPNNEGFIVSGPFIFDGKIDKAKAIVMASGHVSIEKERL